MKRIDRLLICALVLCALLLSGCAAPWEPPDDGRLRIVTTLFPYYDFARAVAGDKADVTLLLSPGREAHSFEPTPLDAARIARADVFVYNGGESEEWVEDMLGAVGGDIGTVLRMMDYVEAAEEEFVEGMQGAEDGEDSDEIEYDEHVWTSP
ncbi:MAG: zinc ABC transporter substrate-binding protein, partial [Oscillospiraceae bacterium]|nr:zinc ABC transporter substrate-binding protein [Oscillospiraceae bacterium]